jgi:hypothetical protein
VIGLTRDRLAGVAWPEGSPTSSDGGAVAARPLLLKFQRTAAHGWQCAAHRASVSPRGGATSAHWLGEQAEVRARQWLPGGDSRSSGSGEQAVRPGLHAGVQAQVVQEEGLGVLRGHWS